MTSANKTTAGKVYGKTVSIDHSRPQKKYHSDTNLDMPYNFGKFDEPDYRFQELKRKISVYGVNFTGTIHSWLCEDDPAMNKTNIYCNIQYSDLVMRVLNKKSGIIQQDITDRVLDSVQSVFDALKDGEMRTVCVFFLQETGYRAVINEQGLSYESKKGGNDV